jgi:hypothetical protein
VKKALPRRTPRKRSPSTSKLVAATPVTAAELRQLKKELERRVRAGPDRIARGARRRPASGPARWNPDPEDVQKSVAQLVLTIVEFLRQLMERQAIRRMENKTLTKKEIEDVGIALMRLEETVRDIGKRFGLTPEDLNLDIGLIKLI